MAQIHCMRFGPTACNDLRCLSKKRILALKAISIGRMHLTMQVSPLSVEASRSCSRVRPKLHGFTINRHVCASRSYTCYTFVVSCSSGHPDCRVLVVCIWGRLREMMDTFVVTPTKPPAALSKADAIKLGQNAVTKCNGAWTYERCRGLHLTRKHPLKDHWKQVHFLLGCNLAVLYPTYLIKGRMASLLIVTRTTLIWRLLVHMTCQVETPRVAVPIKLRQRVCPTVCPRPRQ